MGKIKNALMSIPKSVGRTAATLAQASAAMAARIASGAVADASNLFGPLASFVGKTGVRLAARLGLPISGGAVATGVTMGAVAVAVLVGGFGAYYAITKQPLPFMPGLPEVPIIGGAIKALPPRYVFSIHGVTQPLGVALSPDGKRVYVTEGSGQRLVRFFDPEGKPLGAFPPPPGAEKLLRLPVSVAIGQDGKVYVSDRVMRAVHIYKPDGAYVSPFLPQGSAGLLAEPLALTLDDKGELYVTEVSLGAHRVMEFTPAGQLKRAFGREGRGEGEFSFPNAIVIDRQGRFYISDSNNNRVLYFDKDGTYLGRLPGLMGMPRGLALDDLGRLYVVDSIGAAVWVFDTKEKPAKLLFTFGVPGAEDGQFRYPNGIAVDGRTGRVYVTDFANNRVSVWAY